MALPFLSHVATSLAQQVATQLISLAAEEMKLVWGFKKDLETFGNKLQVVQALLQDASNRRVSLESVQVWLKKLHAVASDADGLLDELAFEALRRRLEMRRRDKVRNFFLPSNLFAFRFKVAHKVKDINSCLDEIYQEAGKIGLKLVEFFSAADSECREIIRLSQPFVDDESNVVGRGGDVVKLVEMLLRTTDEDNLPVTAIVGMGGLGKTTLAQIVYKNDQVVRHFGARMWVCVSRDFNVTRLLNQMIEPLTETNPNLSSIEALIKSLERNLNGKRFLLVLDDVWNDNPQSWELMRSSLGGIHGARGSKIMVTTRSQLVVSAMQVPTPLCLELDVLLEDDAWELFKQRAFGNGGPEETSNLVDVGRRLVRRCGGLPLAIKALGGLLHSKKDESEWLSIEGSEIWSSPEKANGIDILPTLRLSFDNLPSLHMKQCFVYLSNFPKGGVFSREGMIHAWMALGYLLPPRGSNLVMEDIGDEYFNFLLWNSLLQVVERGEYDRIARVRMHDLVFDLARHVSELSGTSDNKVCLYENKNAVMLPNLRILSSRSLDELPSSIFKLKHLRHLRIIQNPTIRYLPNSITKLYNLQTLDMGKCPYLEELPIDFAKLPSLRHFHMDDDEKRRKLMPAGMGQLTCLQTIPFFAVGKDGGRGIEELGCLTNLRGVLKIYNLEHVRSRDEAEKAKLSANSRIHELKLHWCGERDNAGISKGIDEDVLEGLKPNRNVKGLTIENFDGGKLASWMMVPSHASPLLHSLVKLFLRNCKNLEHIPTLGHLPHLKVLAMEGIHNVKSIGSEFYVIRETTTAAVTSKSVFPALRDLSLVDMPNLVTWSEVLADSGSDECTVLVFPSLEKLRIEGCSQLETAPGHFPCIKELVIKGINIAALENTRKTLTSLNSLFMTNVSGSDINSALKEFLVNNASVLKELRIESCDGLFSLPKEIWLVAPLEKIRIRGCPDLTCIHEVSEPQENLRQIRIERCDKLGRLPNGLQHLTSLDRLLLYGCPNLVGINRSGIHGLRLLRRLMIVGCGMLRASSNCWPEWLFSLTGLEVLSIGGFSEELDYFPWPPSNSPTSSNSQKNSFLVSLTRLQLVGWPKLKSLPDQLQNMTGLGRLNIHRFDGVEALPDWLSNLSSLEFLTLSHCGNLTHFPSVQAMQRLTKLCLLEIKGCPRLAERCKRRSGPEWHKIAHIKTIEIDGDYIQNKS